MIFQGSNLHNKFFVHIITMLVPPVDVLSDIPDAEILAFVELTNSPGFEAGCAGEIPQRVGMTCLSLRWESHGIIASFLQSQKTVNKDDTDAILLIYLWCFNRT